MQFFTIKWVKFSFLSIIFSYNFGDYWDNNYDGNKYISFQDLLWSKRGNFSTFSINFYGTYERWLVIAYWYNHGMWYTKYQFSVFSLKRPLVLNYPVSFEPGSARCSSALYLFYSFLLLPKVRLTVIKYEIKQKLLTLRGTPPCCFDVRYK